MDLGAQRSAEAARLHCGVCGLLVGEARTLVEERGGPSAALGREAMADLVERLCTLQAREGRWLRYLDIVGQRELRVERRGEPGECRSECVTVRAACGLTLRSQEEALVAALWEGLSVDEMTRRVCGKACNKKRPPLAEPRKDEEFVPDPRGLGVINMLEKREDIRRETGQVVEVMSREEMDQQSAGDQEVLSAQDAFAEQLREARRQSGRDWRGNDIEL
uniref:Saposin B-type domain-containing protein n=1 Tax=Pyrodinium bahamense TaxID=73915 RepID=A0A7S0A0L1_9DINO